jgi:glucose-1-phosphate thymidylyltransferase
LNRDAGGKVVAVIPAAGWGTRLGDSVPGSKEAVELEAEPLIGHLLRRLAAAGIGNTVVVLREGKRDVSEALDRYEDLGVELVTIVVEESPSELHSVALGLASAGDCLVALGYPDVMFEPEDAFEKLITRQRETGADLVLGLFPCEHPESVDMVVLDEDARPVDVVIKQPDRGLRYSWSMAVWTPVFSRRLVEYVDRWDDVREQSSVEPCVGDVVSDAIAAGSAVEAAIFEDGRYLNISTPNDLKLANEMAAGSHEPP